MNRPPNAPASRIHLHLVAAKPTRRRPFQFDALMNPRFFLSALLLLLVSTSLRGQSDDIQQRLQKYVPVRLITDVTELTERQRKMIPLLIEAAKIMDRCFWYEAYGDKPTLLQSISDPATRRFAIINYGPWDRLAGNEPFVSGVGSKPPGANFYPPDMTKEEFEAADLNGKDSLYTFLRRNAVGSLATVPYREQFSAEVAP